MVRHGRNNEKLDIARRIARILLFVIGLTVFVYPYAAQYVNNRSATRLVQEYFASSPSNQIVDPWITSPGDFVQVTYDENGNELPANVSGGGYSGGYEGEIFGSIQIPKLGLELPIFTGSTTINLNKGIAHLEGTSLPVGGESTHSVLCGHNGSVTNEWFTHIDRMAIGDLFYIRTREQTLTYKVVSIKIIGPYDLSELYIRPGEDLVTLLTCAEGGKTRLIVTGERV